MLALSFEGSNQSFQYICRARLAFHDLLDSFFDVKAAPKWAEVLFTLLFVGATLATAMVVRGRGCAGALGTLASLPLLSNYAHKPVHKCAAPNPVAYSPSRHPPRPLCHPLPR